MCIGRLSLSLLLLLLLTVSIGAERASIAVEPLRQQNFGGNRQQNLVGVPANGWQSGVLQGRGNPGMRGDAADAVGQSDYFSSQSDSGYVVPQSSVASSGRPKGIPISLEAQWYGNSDLDLTTYDASLKLPLLFGGNSPPPIMKFGFGFTDLAGASSFGLPEDLYEYSAGVSWVRKFNERWALRTMLGIGFATDGLNTSSDAWQFRGGVFAIYEKSPQWKWTFGALALGRSDLPVVPAIGAIWQPNETTRVDLLLPTLKANFLISDDGTRQQWAYLGGGINGNTWGYEKTDQTDDTLTYSDLRLVAGWESRPTAPPGVPYVLGRKFGIEIGYAFSRDLEFEDETREVELDDAIFLRVSTNY